MTTTAKLSCNHTIEDVHEDTQVGEKISCNRCKAKADGSMAQRTIKSIVREVEQVEGQLEAEAAERALATVTVDETGALLDRNDRRTAAKFEAKQLKDWRKAGDEQAQRPATPNLDQLEAEAKTNRKPNGAKATPRKATPAKTARQQTALNAQTKEARDACGGKRGPGGKSTLEGLTGVCRMYQEQHPDATSASCMEHAYYVMKLAFSRQTWAKAWEAASQA